MMRSWRVGTAFGIPIYIHWSFALLLIWVLFFQTPDRDPAQMVFVLCFVLAMFGCIILHELGHALMARVFGIGTKDITLYPIGGVARLESTGRKPSEELLIAVAGPAVNVAIVLILAIPLLVLFMMNPALVTETILGQFFLFLATGNIIVVLFNMIPAFPMDGGRVFRALLTYPMGALRATRVAVWVGGVFAILGIAVGVLNPQFIFLTLIGVFIFFAGQQELRVTEMKEQMRYYGYGNSDFHGRPKYRDEDYWEYPEYRETSRPGSPPTNASPSVDPQSDFMFRPKVNVYVWDEENSNWVKQ